MQIISFQKWMTNTIQFWMDIILNNILPKIDDQYNPILDESYTKNNLPKMDDHIHPTLDDYCSFCSLYEKGVSFSSKFGRISHITIQLPKVEENRSIIFFHCWKQNIPRFGLVLSVPCLDSVMLMNSKFCSSFSLSASINFEQYGFAVHLTNVKLDCPGVLLGFF